MLSIIFRPDEPLRCLSNHQESSWYISDPLHLNIITKGQLLLKNKENIIWEKSKIYVLDSQEELKGLDKDKVKNKSKDKDRSKGREKGKDKAKDKSKGKDIGHLHEALFHQDKEADKRNAVKDKSLLKK